jgi:hypothetical protein
MMFFHYQTIKIMEVKQEIAQIVDKLPQEVLDELLRYLRKIEKANEENVHTTLNLEKILIEDDELLRKLA